jgi:murein L,D-transpeptidase YafK
MRRSRIRRTGPLSVIYLGVALLACLHTAISSSASDFELADRVVVKKSERKLLLMSGSRVIRSVDVVLGLAPKGHKSTEGDFRTPEGTYMLTERNPASDFFLSIRISYPKASDERQAKLSGISPGGQIMIHGQPNNPKHSADYYRMTDWTDGCIAVSNSDMVDIWLMTQSDIPIQILP